MKKKKKSVKKKQPARRQFLFGRSFACIFRLFVNTCRAAWDPIANEAHRIRRTNVFLAILSVLCDVTVFPLAALLIMVWNILCTAVLLTGAAVLWVLDVLLMVLVFLFDFLYCIGKGIASHCPNCQHKFLLPSYRCPKCGAQHTKLRPGTYGILFRKCRCGGRLPTTFFNGRQKLKAFCPYCNTDLKDGGKHVEIVIPVVGGASAGKTCFINMAISAVERVAPNYNLAFRYSATPYDDYLANKSRMQSGLLPDKTNDHRLQYYQFYLTPQGVKLENLISFCDVAGETYESSHEMGEQIGYKYANAFLMVIDPLSVRGYRRALAGKVDFDAYGASEQDIDSVLSTLISTLENLKCLTPKNMLKTDVAVVFTKCDIPGLDDRIGDRAARREMQTAHLPSIYEARNAVCEKFLLFYGESNFVNALKSKFRSVQYFSCSSLGHVRNGIAFSSSGVEDPVLWIVDKASTSIDLKQKWGKKI